MEGDSGFVLAMVLLAVPLGILLARYWARSRPPGEVHLRESAGKVPPAGEPVGE